MIRHYNTPDCAIARTLDVLGDGWTMMVLREAFLGTRRFSDFEARLSISKNVLTKRLAHLVEEGLLTRYNAGQYGKRFEYRLTPKGKDLITILTALRQWGDRWIFGEGKEPLLVVDRETNEPIPPVRIRRMDGTPIPSRDLQIQPGPGASPEFLERWSQAKRAREPERTEEAKGSR